MWGGDLVSERTDEDVWERPIRNDVVGDGESLYRLEEDLWHWLVVSKFDDETGEWLRPHAESRAHWRDRGRETRAFVWDKASG